MKGAAKIWAQSRPEGRRRDGFPIEALRFWVDTEPIGVVGGKRDAACRRRWLRDAALVGLGMRLMLRPSELVGLKRKHIRFDEKGWMWVRIEKRKNDQLGLRGEDPVEPVEGSRLCVVKLVRAWLRRGIRRQKQPCLPVY